MSEVSGSTTDNDKRIDINGLLLCMNQCFNSDGAVVLAVYLKAYRNLERFFCLLGRVFGFVASDVSSKIEILENYLKSDTGKEYETVESMLTHEKAAKIIGGKQPSGSRTLLRLHWALEFIVDFLEKVEKLEDAAKTCPASQEAYTKTLGTHHPWIIRKAALLAMHALPTAKGLVEQTCVQSVAEVRAVLPQLVERARKVYEATQSCYQGHNCLDLS